MLFWSRLYKGIRAWMLFVNYEGKESHMPLGVALVLIPVCLVGGIMLFRAGKRAGNRMKVVAGIALCAVFAGCLLYTAAASLLLGAID